MEKQVLQRDETAPILTLDKSSVTANASTGKFTITGYTKPGAEVVWMILCVVCISGAVVLYGRKRRDN